MAGIPLVLLALSLSVPAQQPSPQNNEVAPAPVLKATTRLVMVDVIADDGHGKPVPDLKPEDFNVTEDGREQRVRSMVFMHPGATPRSEPRQPLPPGTFTNKPAFPRESTLNVVLLDALNTNVADQTSARKQMLKFVEKMPTDEPIAVYTLGSKLRLIQDFTSDPQVLRRAIAGLTSEVTPLSSKSADDQLPPGYLDEIATGPGGASNPNPTGQSATAGGGPGNSTQMQIDILLFEKDVITFQDDIRTAYTLDSLQALARRLSGFIGRKNLIWLSAGFPVAVTPDLALGANAFSPTRNRNDEIARTANALIDAQIAVYPVDIRGLVGSSSAASNGMDSMGRSGISGPAMVDKMRRDADNLSFAQDSSKDLADRTGGKAFYNRNDFDTAVQNSVNDGSTYYLLSYYPDNKNWNGKFRKLQVKVNRPGVKVRSRLGYYATDPAIYQKADKKEEEKEFSHALSADLPLSTALTFQAHVEPPSAATRNKVAVTYNVDAHGIAFDLSPDGSSHGEIECAVGVYSAKGKLLSYQTDFMNAAIKPENLPGVLQRGFPCDQSFSLPKGEYLLRLGVRDTHSGLFGTANGRVSVP